MVRCIPGLAAENFPQLSFSQHGTPAYANTSEGIDALCQQLINDRPSVVAVDAQHTPPPWDPHGTPLAGPAALQLCYASGSPTSSSNGNGASYSLTWKCLVLHLVAVPHRMTAKLWEVLHHGSNSRSSSWKGPTLLIWGNENLKRLLCSFYPGLQPECHDFLKQIYWLNRRSPSFMQQHLQALVNTAVDYSMDKSLQCGNASWEQLFLTPGQIMCAASDCYALLRLWSALVAKVNRIKGPSSKGPNPTRQLPRHFAPPGDLCSYQDQMSWLEGLSWGAAWVPIKAGQGERVRMFRQQQEQGAQQQQQQQAMQQQGSPFQQQQQQQQQVRQQQGSPFQQQQQQGRQQQGSTFQQQQPQQQIQQQQAQRQQQGIPFHPSPCGSSQGESSVLAAALVNSSSPGCSPGAARPALFSLLMTRGRLPHPAAAAATAAGAAGGSAGISSTSDGVGIGRGAAGGATAAVMAAAGGLPGGLDHEQQQQQQLGQQQGQSPQMGLQLPLCSGGFSPVNASPVAARLQGLLLHSPQQREGGELGAGAPVDPGGGCTALGPRVKEEPPGLQSQQYRTPEKRGVMQQQEQDERGHGEQAGVLQLLRGDQLGGLGLSGGGVGSSRCAGGRKKQRMWSPGEGAHVQQQQQQQVRADQVDAGEQDADEEGLAWLMEVEMRATPVPWETQGAGLQQHGPRSLGKSSS